MRKEALIFFSRGFFVWRQGRSSRGGGVYGVEAVLQLETFGGGANPTFARNKKCEGNSKDMALELEYGIRIRRK